MNMYYYPTLLTLWLSILSCQTNISAKAEEGDTKWSFIVLADWHGAEGFARVPGRESKNYIPNLEILSHISDTYGGDLVLIPGDTNGGHWDRKKYQEFFPDKTPEEVVFTAGTNCYSTIVQLFNEAGYNKVLISIGDHEIGGNAWQLNSVKMNSLPSFRGSFANELNKDSTGKHLYSDPIGVADARPYETIFSGTSYAHQHKNALFITVDAFYQVEGVTNFIDRENGLGGEGVVTCTVTGKHLVWLESVLREATTNAESLGIKHIFVQAHLPMLQPVRKINCSGQFMDNAKNSEFWKLMAEHRVDVYFAGEVHATTATQDSDPDSNVVQIVSRGNRLSNFLKFDITDDVIDVTSYNEIGKKFKWNGEYRENGSMTIDKSNSENHVFSSAGVLQIVATNVSLISLNFEKILPLGQRPVIGMKYNENKLIGESIDIRGARSTQATPNNGSFKNQYDAQVVDISLETGRHGLAARFISTSRMAIQSVGPLTGGEITSFALWFKTNQSGESVLYHYGHSWQIKVAKSTKDSFILTLNNGNPTLYTAPNKMLVSVDNQNLNNGEFHHIAVSMPKKSCLLSEVILFVDGKEISTTTPQIDEHIFFGTSGRMSLGGFGYTSLDYEIAFPNLRPFEGLMDFFRFYARPILPKDIAQAMAKGFRINWDKTCVREPDIGIIEKAWKPNKCRKVCTKRKRCRGYEANKQTKTCVLYMDKKPEVGDTQPGTRCAIVTD